MNNWIPVTEKLPGPFETVLVSIATKNGFDERTTVETIGDFTHGTWNIYTGRLCEGERVTHWMKMPEPPTKEDKDNA